MPLLSKRARQVVDASLVARRCTRPSIKHELVLGDRDGFADQRARLPVRHRGDVGGVDHLRQPLLAKDVRVELGSGAHARNWLGIHSRRYDGCPRQPHEEERETTCNLRILPGTALIDMTLPFVMWS